MSINIRYPNITGHTDADQLMQIKSFLHQLVEQLNWALSFSNTGSSSENSASTQNPNSDVSAESLYELRSLIVKSTAMLNEYYEEINKKLEGQYVTQADFDAYKAEPKYTLPIGGATLGGVKNGGNVVIETDGTMNVDVPSDEHIIELINSILADTESGNDNTDSGTEQ